MRKLFTLIGLLVSFASFAAVGPITGPTSVCVGSTVTLSDTTAGGTWSSSNPSIASIGSATGIATGNTAGVVTITYSAPGGSAVRTLTVSALPSAIGGSSTACTGTPITLTNTVAGGTWVSSDASIASIGSSSGILTGTTAGTVDITYTTVCGAAYKTVTVNTSPAAITGAGTLCVGASTSMANATAGGTWSSTVPSKATVGSASGIVTGVAAGTSNIVYTVPNGCTASKQVTVTTTPVAITGPSTVCPGSQITLADATEGGIWTSSSPSVASVGTGSGIVTGVTGGIVIITYAVAGCGNAYKNVTVNAAPAAIGGSSSVCMGSSITLTNITAGGTWSSADAALATVGATTGIVDGIAAGVVNISYTAGGCSSYKPITVIGVSPITGSSTVCVGSSITLADSISGGTWNSSTPSVATIGATTGIVNGIALGTTTISYLNSGCLTTKIVTVTAAPAPITGPGSVCVGASITLANSMVGGSWYSANALIATVDSTSGIVNGVSVGFATIYYAVPGCGNVLKTISVNPTPAAISGLSSVCVGSSIALTNTSGGGTWSSSNVSVAVIGSSSGILNGIAAGTVNISYFLGGCGTGTTINVITPAPIMGSSSVCVGSVTTLTNAATGGTWLSTNASVATIDTGGVVTGMVPGISTISYQYPGCATSMILTVIAVPAAITGPGAVCTGAAMTLANSVSGGSWSSSDVSVATIGSSSGVVNGIAAGLVTITYSTGSCGSAYKTITVNQTPAPIVGGSIMCAGSSITLTNTVAGGSWTSSNTLVATVGAASGVVTTLTSGIVNISYTLSTCSVVKTITITATTAAITGPGNVCAGASITLANATAGGSWTSSNTAIGLAGSSTGIITGVSAGIVSISYLVTGCTGVAKNVTVNPAPGVITGPNEMCVTSTIVLADATPGGAWTSSDPSIATIVPTTGLVTSISPGVVTMSYTAAGCSATKLVTVTAVPPPIVGSSTLCSGASTTFTDAATGGTWGTWYSSTTSVATIDSATGVIDGIVPGTTTISYYYGGCIVTKILTVTVTPVAITGTASVCSGSTTTLADATTGGVWSSSNTAVATIDASSGVVTGVSGGLSTISYFVGACGVSTMVTVNETPPAIAGNNAVCTGLTTALSNTMIGGTWSTSNAALATVDAVTGVVSGVAVGTVNISYTHTGCTTSKVVTVSTCPGKISGNITEIVAGAPYPMAGVMVNLKYVSSGNVAAVTYTTLAGTYEFNTLPEDSYFVYPQETGYVTVPSGAINITTAAPIVGNINFIYNKTDSTITPAVNGVAQLSEGKLSVYPNPTSGLLNIKWEDRSMTGATVVVTDVTGRDITTTVISDKKRYGSTQLDLSGLSDGIYLVTIKSEAISYKYKVSVQQ